MTSIIGLSLALLQGLLKQGGLAQEIVADVQIAIDALTRVHGSAVTKQQIEEARFTPGW